MWNPLADCNVVEFEQDWRGPQADPLRAAYRERLVCWILRIYTGAHGSVPYNGPGDPMQRHVARLLELPLLADPQATATQVRSALQAAAKKILAQPASGVARIAPDDLYRYPMVSDCSLRTNIEWLAGECGFSPSETAVLELACALVIFKPLRTAQDIWGELMVADVANAISALIELPRADIEQILHPNSRLIQSGLLSPPQHSESSLQHMLRVPRRMAQRLAMSHANPIEILSNLMQPLQTSPLAMESFSHITADTELVRVWLHGAMDASRRSEPAGHLLVFGDPGLGKTQWIRALVKQEGVHAIEMVVLDEHGRALGGSERLEHLRVAMLMLERRRGGVILFDEADDVFCSGHGGLADPDFNPGGDGVSMLNHRASLNQLIEKSRTPVIWIMNNPEVLDEAVRRRFDSVIEFKQTPQSVRLQLLRNRMGQGGIDSAELERWAQIPSLTPALIDRLATVRTRALRSDMVMDAELCRHWLRQRLPGKESGRLQTTVIGNDFGKVWNSKYVNASEHLDSLMAGIARVGSARLLLYGVPGTGKTAFAHALAERMDRPLLEKRASDLLSPYVGETEQRISQAFDTALQEGSVLLLDEVDSMLSRRDQAVRNWEVSLVNELLEQLGDFPGVVVLATNRLDALEPAVLRRMDAKIHFEVMRPTQVQSAFVQLCLALKLEVSAQEMAEVAGIAQLTPGDFSCVARKLRFREFASTPGPVLQCIAMLKEEVKLKGAAVPRSIGFHVN